MVDDYCTSIPESFYVSYFPHASHWPRPRQPITLHIFAQVFPWTYLWVSPSISSFTLHLPPHCHYQFLYIFLSWYTLDSIIKVITSSPLPLTNKRRHYQFFYGLWHQSPHNQCHQWTSPLFVILLRRSFYLQLWIDITTAITLGNLYFILFTSPNIIPWVLISSLICHLLSTGIWISSNLVPPVIKFRKFLLTVKSFLGSTIALMMVFPLFVFIQESKEI